MNKKEIRFLTVLHSLMTKGSVGVGLFLPLPEEVQSLIEYGYCSSTPMQNPHKQVGVPDVIVSLTENGRISLTKFPESL